MFIKVSVLDVYKGSSATDGRPFCVITFRPLTEGARDIKVFADEKLDVSNVEKNGKYELGFEMVPDQKQFPRLNLVSISPLN